MMEVRERVGQAINPMVTLWADIVWRDGKVSIELLSQGYDESILPALTSLLNNMMTVCVPNMHKQEDVLRKLKSTQSDIQIS